MTPSAALAASLDAARRKLVMSATVDVAGDVEDLLAGGTLADAYRLAHAVSGARVTSWYEQLRPLVDDHVRAGAAEQLESCGEILPAVAILPTGPTFQVSRPRMPTLWRRATDRLRSRAAPEGIALAISLLARDSLRAVDACLAYYDDAMESVAACLADVNRRCIITPPPPGVA